MVLSVSRFMGPKLGWGQTELCANSLSFHVPAWGGDFADGCTEKDRFWHSGSLQHMGGECSSSEPNISAPWEREEKWTRNSGNWTWSNSAHCSDWGESLNVSLPLFSHFIHLIIQQVCIECLGCIKFYSSYPGNISEQNQGVGPGMGRWCGRWGWEIKLSTGVGLGHRLSMKNRVAG